MCAQNGTLLLFEANRDTTGTGGQKPGPLATMHSCIPPANNYSYILVHVAKQPQTRIPGLSTVPRIVQAILRFVLLKPGIDTILGFVIVKSRTE